MIVRCCFGGGEAFILASRSSVREEVHLGERIFCKLPEAFLVSRNLAATIEEAQVGGFQQKVKTM